MKHYKKKYKGKRCSACYRHFKEGELQYLYLSGRFCRECVDIRERKLQPFETLQEKEDKYVIHLTKFDVIPEKYPEFHSFSECGSKAAWTSKGNGKRFNTINEITKCFKKLLFCNYETKIIKI